MALKPGDIVRADLPDPDGNPCAVPHRAMVLKVGSLDAWVVGITTSFNDPPPNHWIRLPFATGGHATTGLTEDCVLKCNWLNRKLLSQLSAPIGVVSPEIYDRAVDQVLSQVEKKKLANRGER